LDEASRLGALRLAHPTLEAPYAPFNRFLYATGSMSRDVDADPMNVGALLDDGLAQKRSPNEAKRNPGS